MKGHPEKCSNCLSNNVSYKRFALTRGEYVCPDCGWGMDAETGKITEEGEHFQIADEF